MVSLSTYLFELIDPFSPSLSKLAHFLSLWSLYFILVLVLKHSLCFHFSLHLLFLFKLHLALKDVFNSCLLTVTFLDAEEHWSELCQPFWVYTGDTLHVFLGCHYKLMVHNIVRSETEAIDG